MKSRMYARLFTLIGLPIALGASLACAQTSMQPGANLRLIWSDEFDGPANAPPDPANWIFDLGAGGWGNGEQETYTSSARNAFQDGNGHLVIRAIRDAQGQYTSARIKTKANWRYGRMEARIQIPFGAGIWPAFWMLGADIDSAHWPACGEIDILENFGAKVDPPSTVHGTIHGPGYSGGQSIGAPYRLPSSTGAAQSFDQGFHIFAVEWSANSIVFQVDGMTYETLTPAALPKRTRWAFDHPFFLLLNLAIGGRDTFLGAPTDAVRWPQDMLVDYVRVYARPSTPPS